MTSPLFQPGHLQMKLRESTLPTKVTERWETHDPDGSSVSLAPRALPLSPLHWSQGLASTISVTLYSSKYLIHLKKKSKEYWRYLNRSLLVNKMSSPVKVMCIYYVKNIQRMLMKIDIKINTNIKNMFEKPWKCRLFLLSFENIFSDDCAFWFLLIFFSLVYFTTFVTRKQWNWSHFATPAWDFSLWNGATWGNTLQLFTRWQYSHIITEGRGKMNKQSDYVILKRIKSLSHQAYWSLLFVATVKEGNIHFFKFWKTSEERKSTIIWDPSNSPCHRFYARTRAQCFICLISFCPSGMEGPGRWLLLLYYWWRK